MSDHAYGINNVLHLAVAVGKQLRQLKYTFCFIGGVAYQRWGEPRQTVDVDGTILVEFGRERELARVLTSFYRSRVEDAEEFAVQNRIVLLKSKEGLGIDLSLGGMPYEERMIGRASDWSIPEHGTVRTCSPEDLVVLKAFADRPQDWIDIEKVAIRQGQRLDRDLILVELAPLVDLKEEPEILAQLHRIFARVAV